MKLAITGSKNTRRIVSAVKSYGFSIDQKRPDFVITYGGDGSILYAEREYPGIPKITIRASSAGFKCMYEEPELKGVLDKVREGKYTLREEMKLEAEINGEKHIALNEIQLRNKSPVKAIRFSVYSGHEPIFEKIVGDGVVVATPFGSSAYFSSVGGKEFKKGIGAALNNPHRFDAKPFEVADASSEVYIKVLRDEGVVYYDNVDAPIDVKEGDEIIVKAAQDTAKFVIVK